MNEEDLPKGWESARITEVAEVNPRHSPELGDDLDVGFIPMSAVDEYLGAVTTFDVRRLGVVKKGYTPMQTGDVIFAKITPCMENGKSAIVCDLPSKTGFGSTEFFVIRPSSGVPPEWIHRFIRQGSFRRTAREHMAGAVGQARVPRGFLEETELPIPPLPEQRRIVAKLDALQSRTRIAREALDTVAPLLKGFRQSVLQAAVTGALTEEWRGEQGKSEPWKDVALHEIAMDFSYGTATKSSKTGDIPVLRMGNIQDGKLDWNGLVYTSDKAEIKKFSLTSGDVLFNRTNSPELVGKSAVYRGEQPAVYAGYLIKVRCGALLLPDYLNYSLSSPFGRDWCWEVKTDGVSQSNISAGKLSQYRLELPPLAEQTEIVRRVQHLFAMADAMEVEFAAAQRSVEQLDQSLLATAFRGELVPQDPSDEPASVLLERIRAARAALPDTKGKRGRKASSEPDSSVLMAAESAAPKKRGRPQKG